MLYKKHLRNTAIPTEDKSWCGRQFDTWANPGLVNCWAEVTCAQCLQSMTKEPSGDVNYKPGTVPFWDENHKGQAKAHILSAAGLLTVGCVVGIYIAGWI